MKDYSSKRVLITNIATRCGYTPQLEALNKMYLKNKDSLIIIGVPSNEFGGQSPESNEEIVDFCKVNYGVKFPIINKTKVKGNNAFPLIRYLVEKSDKKEVQWSFEKFLIYADEIKIKHFSSNELDIIK